MSQLEWHFLDTNNEQKGPVSFDYLKTAWAQKLLVESTLVWNEDLPEWVEARTLPNLMAHVKPAVAKKPPPMKAPVRAPAPVVEVKAPEPEPEPESKASNWKAFQTPEGLEYYHNDSTGETTWDKPDALKSPDELDKAGDWMWCPEDTPKAFVPARKVQSYSDGSIELEKENGERVTFKAKQAALLEPLVWSQLRRLQKDLVMLDIMNRPLIVHNLRCRLEENEIYTNVGTILISVNPYKRLPLYTPTMINKYRQRGTRILDPHVFTIADDAYNSLTEYHKPQSIVISGESGAGKTEATKQCLQYLAEIAGSEGNVEQQILKSNPILEAFGNAKTVRNNNSSRFGKYVEIFFDGRGTICGATNTNYLLEKSRVVYQGEGERNYHIFYELSLGASDSQRSKYRLRHPTEFFYLNQGTIEIEGQDDVEEFGILEDAMKLLEFSEQEKDDIYRIIAGIMHLGNVKFRDVGDRKCEVEGKQELEDAAHLLGMEAGALKNGMTSKILTIRGEDMHVTLSAEESCAARNALAKFIYEKQFDWLVQKVNKAIGKGKGSELKRTIGILDIFGFEIFKVNSFEQLCINFANEKLQQFFNQHTFKLEEALYKREKIQFTHIEYIDNQPVLDLIESKPRGILPMIDEELRMPKGSDQTYVQKLINTHTSNKNFERVLKNPDHFTVKHYAGDVVYEVDGFLEKNRDRLNDDTYQLLDSTKHTFLKQLFSGSAGSSTAANRRKTLGAKFSGQLQGLMDTLNSTEPHYIRCVKPNPNKAPLQFYGNMVLEQLQYAGVFEAIQIRKNGYPFRLTHEQFVKRFKCVTPKVNYTNYRSGAESLIRSMKQDASIVQIGTTMVLYRAEQHRSMELVRNLAVEKTVIYIQKWVRRFLAQNLLKKMRAIKPELQRLLVECKRSRDMDAIDRAIEKASKISPFFVMYEVKELKWLKHVIVEEKKVIAQLSDLLKQDPEVVYEKLSRVVASATEIGLQSPEVEKAREIVEFIKEKRRVAAALNQGIEEFDEDVLRENLEKATQLGVQENVDKAYEMLNALITEKQYLYDNAIYQLAYLEEEQMQDVMSRADGINYTTPEIEEIRTLLLNTPEEKFVQMQLKAAIQNNDQQRAIKVTIRLKDLVFEKQAAMYTFENFGVLRDKVEWAGMKFLSFSKDELAAGMLHFSPKPIHAALTEVPSKDNKVAKLTFKNIMGYMGDREYNSPAILAKELVDMALEHPNVRDEIYCQIIKQLRRNPNAQSVSRGWQLMAICLEAFPPKSEFENYLEIFLRDNANPRDRYVYLLHQAVYGGPIQVPMTEADIQKIANGQPYRMQSDIYVAEERAEQKEALAFGGMGPSFAPKRAPVREGGAATSGPPPGAPPSGPPAGPPPGRGGFQLPAKQGPPAGGPPRGAPPRGAPPAGAPPRGAPPRGPAPGRGAPPAGAPPRGAPPRGAPPRGPAPGRGAPMGGPPRGAPPAGAPPRGAPPRGPAPGRGAPMGGPPRGAPPAGAPPRGPPMGGPPRGAPPRGAPPRGAPPRGAPPRGPPMGGPPRGAPPRGPAPGRSPPTGGPPRGAPPRGPAPGRGPPTGGPPRGAPARGPAPGRGPPRGPAPGGPAPGGPAPGFQLPQGAFAMPGMGGPPRGGAPRPQMPSRGPPPSAPAPKKSAWVIVHHPETGEPYYHNQETNAVQWDKPADFQG